MPPPPVFTEVTFVSFTKEDPNYIAIHKQEYLPGRFFNVIADFNGTFILTPNQVAAIPPLSTFDWIKGLPLIPWVKPLPPVGASVAPPKE